MRTQLRQSSPTYEIILPDLLLKDLHSEISKFDQHSNPLASQNEPIKELGNILSLPQAPLWERNYNSVLNLSANYEFGATDSRKQRNRNENMESTVVNL